MSQPRACLLLVAYLLLAWDPPTRGQARQEARQAPGEKVLRRTDRYGDPLPAGAIARLGTVRLRHLGPVCSIAFSPDGKTLAASGGDHKLHLWDVVTGREIRQYSGPPGQYSGQPEGFSYCVAFSPDGKTLISGGLDGTIRFWDVATGKQVRQLVNFGVMLHYWDAAQGGDTGVELNKPFPILSIALSPDGQTLASGSEFRTLRLWAVATGKERRRCAGQENWIARLVETVTEYFAFSLPAARAEVECLAFAPDGKTLASGGTDRTIHLWRVATGREFHRCLGHQAEIRSLSFAPDGKTLASASVDGTIRLWDLATKRELRKLGGSQGEVNAAVFAPDGKTLASAGADPEVHLWEVATGKELRSFHGHQGYVEALAFSPDGKLLASGSFDQTISLWDVASGRELHPYEGHRGAVSSVAFSPDGRALASGGADRPVRLWDRATGKELRELRGHRYGTRAVTFSPDGKLLASGGGDQTVSLWDARTGRPVRRFRAHEWSVGWLHFSSDGKTLASAGADKISLWDLKTGRELRHFGAREAGYNGLSSLALSPDGKVLASNSCDLTLLPSDTIHLWRTDTGKEFQQLSGCEGRAHSIAFSPDGRMLAAGGDDRMIRLWEVSTGKERCRLQGHGASVLAIAFSPDGKSLASGGDSPDASVRLWDVGAGKVIHILRGHQGTVNAVAFSPDGKCLASGGRDSTVLVWEVADVSKPRPSEIRLRAEEVEALWADLAGADAPRAYQAIGRLARAPEQSVPYLRARLKPVPRPERHHIRRLIAELDSDRFAVREKAAAELEQYGEVAEAALRQAFTQQRTAEVRRRIDQILEQLHGPVRSPERLRALRAVELLEHIGKAEARAVLRELASGAPEARLTQEAQAAVRRLAKRPAAMP